MGWFLLFFFAVFTGIRFAYLFVHDKDYRKLLFSVGFLESAIVYPLLAFGYSRETSGYPINTIFTWCIAPLIGAIFIAINESLIKITNFKKIFNFFIGFTIFTSLMMFFPIDVSKIISTLYLLISSESIIVTLYFFLRYKERNDFFFFLTLIGFTISSIALSQGLHEVSIIFYFFTYILLTLIVVKTSVVIKQKTPRGMLAYFSLRQQLEASTKALQETEEQFQLIVESINDVLMITEPDKTISYINPTSLKIFGYPPEELIGKTYQLVHPDDIEKIRLFFLQTLTGTSGLSAEYRILTKTGQLKWVSHTWSSMVQDGQLNKILNIIRDITQKKEMESKINEKIQALTQNEEALLNIMEDMSETSQKLKKLSDIKSAFLNITSHELRTPMSAVKGYLQMMLRDTFGPINKEQQNALNIVLRNTNRLDRLIQDILDISRLESGTMKFVLVKTPIDKMIKETNETMQPSANVKKIKITTSIEKEIPELIIDKDRISQVVINILNNAIKFSPEESTIDVRVKKQNTSILFEMQDRGRGIAKEHHQKIFQTFYQVDSGTDIKFGGAGLGLAICYGIVIAHGGNIWVESEGIPGKGSTFKFTLPLQSVTDIEKRFKGVDVFGLGTQNDEKKNTQSNKITGEMNRLDIQMELVQNPRITEEISTPERYDFQKKYFENTLFLTDTANTLAQFPLDNDIYQYIGEKIQYILQDAHVTLSYFNQNTSTFIVNKILGYGRYTKKILQLLGKDPVGMEFHFGNETMKQKLLGGKLIHLSSEDVEEVIMPQFSKPLSYLVNQIINKDECYMIGLVNKGELFGDVFFEIPKESMIKNLEIIEPFINQASIAIQRNNALKEINNLNENLKIQNTLLQKLNDIKTTFLKNTSHELRTPITAIKGYTQILMKQHFGDLTEEQKKGLEVILRNTDRLDKVIQNILDVTNIQTGTLKLVINETNLERLIGETIKKIQPYALEKKITIHTEIEKGLPYLFIDDEKIKQVLLNLEDNAIKFSSDGSEIYVRIRNENEFILFEVQDFGRGIPLDKQEKIFEPFYQVDSAENRMLGGSGLSLTLCKGIVLLHAGKLWVESTEGKGSIFRFSLPININITSENSK
jgi:PAS domain S-box-containing protein